jgi:tetratricopeptide (TPR) repeat protein
LRRPANWLLWDKTLTGAQVRERLQAAPDDADLHYTLGQRCVYRQREAEAIQEFRRAAELAPQSPTPLLHLGGVLLREPKGNPQAGIRVLQEALPLMGADSWPGHLWLAQAFRQAGRTEDAIAEYRQVVAAGPPPAADAYGSLAALLAQKGDLEGAYRVLADAPPAEVARWWSSPDTIIQYGTQANRLEDLRARARKALANDPRSGRARLLLASVLHAQGNDEEALTTIKDAPLEASITLQTQDALLSLATALGDTGLVAQMVRVVVRET